MDSSIWLRSGEGEKKKKCVGSHVANCVESSPDGSSFSFTCMMDLNYSSSIDANPARGRTVRRLDGCITNALDILVYIILQVCRGKSHPSRQVTANCVQL